MRRHSIVGCVVQSTHLAGHCVRILNLICPQHNFYLEFKGVEGREDYEFKVPGRLALLNANKKYIITIGEILRRVGAPENTNSSLLGAFLRKFVMHIPLYLL